MKKTQARRKKKQSNNNRIVAVVLAFVIGSLVAGIAAKAHAEIRALSDGVTSIPTPMAGQLAAPSVLGATCNHTAPYASANTGLPGQIPDTYPTGGVPAFSGSLTP